ALGLLTAFCSMAVCRSTVSISAAAKHHIAVQTAGGSSSMNWIIPTLTFLGGSMATWLAGRAFEYVTRPVITAQLVQGRGCYVTTRRGNPPTHDARFLRLLVENSGHSPIKNCSSYVVRIAKTANNQIDDVQQEVLELNWSHSDATPRSIPRGTFFSFRY